MSDACEFIDAALQREASWERAEAHNQLGGGLRFYGSSVGAVRGTIRDAGRRYPDLTHDDITALSSELWAELVFERRLAAIVLLQSNLRFLKNSDLTRIEGFVRQARLPALADPLAVDVIGPMIEGFQGRDKARADNVLDRWAKDPEPWVRRAAVLNPLRVLRTGGGDWTVFVRRATAALAEADDDGGIVGDALTLVLTEMAQKRPGLSYP